MKKIISLVIILLAYQNIFSQSTMHFYKGGQISTSIDLKDIDSIKFTPCTTQPNCGTVTDFDNNIYNTIAIGTQCWMKENLRVTHYCNGELIPNVTDNTEWTKLTADAYSNYDNSDNNIDIYGRLYNWHAVNDISKICPTGWHVPSDADWTALTEFLGGESGAGGKMKEAETTHWTDPNTGATNESGFSGLPGGARSSFTGVFGGLGMETYYWSSTECFNTYAWYRFLTNVNADASRSFAWKVTGLSVRCLKDN